MNESFGGGFTANQDGEAKPENKTEGNLPVFIKQIHAQKEDIMKMWGFEYKMVTTVAIVRNIEHSSTKITYTLADITGRINAHFWVEEGEAPAEAGIMLNTYARVIGAVRQQGDVKSIMVYKIQPVKSINEVNTHYIEVVNARYQAEDYCNGGKGAGSGPAAVKMEMANTNASQSTSCFTETGPAGKSRIIFNAIKPQGETQSETGVSRAELKSRFPQFSATEIDNMLEQLTSEGHIYSTVDSEHFMACF